jgi:hypothetical protein
MCLLFAGPAPLLPGKLRQLHRFLLKPCGNIYTVKPLFVNPANGKIPLTESPVPISTPIWLQRVECHSAKSNMLRGRPICTFLILFFPNLNAPQGKCIWISWAAFYPLESNESWGQDWAYSVCHMNERAFNPRTSYPSILIHSVIGFLYLYRLLIIYILLFVKFAPVTYL